MGISSSEMRLKLVAIALIVALSVAWAETNGQAAVLKLVLGGGDQPGSTMKKEDGSPEELAELDTEDLELGEDESLGTEARHRTRRRTISVKKAVAVEKNGRASAPQKKAASTNRGVLQLVLGGNQDQPGSTMDQKKLEEGVTCIGGIPKDCYSETAVPAGNFKCVKTEGEQLTVKKVTVYAVIPKKCKGKLPAGFRAKLELTNVQCECPLLGACFNMKMKNGKNGKVVVQMDSASTATIGRKKKSLDKIFKFDCYVAALQQVMDRKELEASAKEQMKAYQPKAAGGTEEFGEDDEDAELAGLGRGGGVGTATPRVQIEPVRPKGGRELGEEQTAGRRGGSFSPQQKFSLSFANRAGNDEELEELGAEDLE